MPVTRLYLALYSPPSSTGAANVPRPLIAYGTQRLPMICLSQNDTAEIGRAQYSEFQVVNKAWPMALKLIPTSTTMPVRVARALSGCRGAS